MKLNRRNFQILFFLVISINLVAQNAKKPILLILPSDVFCVSKGYYTEFNNGGRIEKRPDYQMAFQNDKYLRLVIAKFSDLMSQRGFPLKDLEQELKKIENDKAENEVTQSSTSGAYIEESPIDRIKRNCKADIILDLDFTINRNGMDKYITFVLKGLDAYTSKQIAGAVGEGLPSSSATTGVLLEEAVLSHLDAFNQRLMSHFEDLFEKGREVRIVLNVFQGSPVNFETEFTVNGKILELTEIIEGWMEKNCVQGRFSKTESSETKMVFEQVRIPMSIKDENDNFKGIDTEYFVRQLRTYLRNQPFNILSKIRPNGLGEAKLILGEK